MEFLIKKYRPYAKHKKFWVSLGIGILFLAVGIATTFFAIVYATNSVSYPVTDIILSNTPVFDVDGIFVYGPIIFWVLLGLYVIAWNPAKLPFTLNSIALFLIIRSIFISMTHIGPFPIHSELDVSGKLAIFATGGDLFFSSHTGMPFLMSLIFWEKKNVRWFCLFTSLFFGAAVLLGHLHYSIDVFGAFFITYSIFKISEKIFKKELQLFINGIEG